MRVAGADAALEDDDQRPLRLDLDQELGALHRRVDEWRFDREHARIAAEEVGGAIQQLDHQRLVVAGQVQRRVLIEPDVRLIDDRHLGAAALADVDDIAGTELFVQRRRTPDAGRLHLRFALQRRNGADGAKALRECRRRHHRAHGENNPASKGTDDHPRRPRAVRP